MTLELKVKGKKFTFDSRILSERYFFQWYYRNKKNAEFDESKFVELFNKQNKEENLRIIEDMLIKYQEYFKQNVSFREEKEKFKKELLRLKNFIKKSDSSINLRASWNYNPFNEDEAGCNFDSPNSCGSGFRN